jgi:outer membrane lipoprotein-sorting protein
MARGVFTAAVILALSAIGVAGQQAAADRIPLAEQVFKNVQVMKGVPADQFMGTMGYMSNSLSVNCTYCHLGEGGGGWAEYARDNDKKVTARRMISMMNEINKTYFAGRRVVTCVSCHNGANRPRVTSNMSVYYSVPNTDEPDQILKQAPGSPSAEQVLDKYLAAIGGAQRLAAVKSWAAKGTHLAYGEAEKRPLQIFARAPIQRVQIEDTGSGSATTVFDGKAGWSAVPDAITPLPLRALTGAELEGARLDAVLAFPGQIKTSLTGWRGAIPATMGDTDVYVIQGAMAGNVPVKLYFDFDSGLLVRQIRYTETPIGRNTWQIDYSDYRDVAGVKMPFKWILMWQSGKVEVELSDVQPNVAIEDARFARPR